MPTRPSRSTALVHPSTSSILSSLEFFLVALKPDYSHAFSLITLKPSLLLDDSRLKDYADSALTLNRSGPPLFFCITLTPKVE